MKRPFQILIILWVFSVGAFAGPKLGPLARICPAKFETLAGARPAAPKRMESNATAGSPRRERRVLTVVLGLPGAGKSEWVRRNILVGAANIGIEDIKRTILEKKREQGSLLELGDEWVEADPQNPRHLAAVTKDAFNVAHEKFVPALKSHSPIFVEARFFDSRLMNAFNMARQAGYLTHAIVFKGGNLPVYNENIKARLRSGGLDLETGVGPDLEMGRLIELFNFDLLRQRHLKGMPKFDSTITIPVERWGLPEGFIEKEKEVISAVAVLIPSYLEVWQESGFVLGFEEDQLGVVNTLLNPSHSLDPRVSSRVGYVTIVSPNEIKDLALLFGGISRLNGVLNELAIECDLTTKPLRSSILNFDGSFLYLEDQDTRIRRFRRRLLEKAELLDTASGVPSSLRAVYFPLLRFKARDK